MERVVCEQCGEWQPQDWTPGDLCVACGAAVRREVRCAWCAGWTPAVRYCRACGCEVVDPERYAAARMLKSAGVDRFTLIQRLQELDPEQALNLARIYNAQLAVVSRRVEEVRCCETYLLQKGFSRRLEETLVPMLPLEKDRLADFAAGPEGPLSPEPESLAEIAENSPIPRVRALASIAVLRLGRFKRVFTVASQALGSDDPTIALEAALAFAHWRVRLSPYSLWRSVEAYRWGGAIQGIDRQRLAQVAGAVSHGSPLRPWAAAAVALAWFGEYGVVPETPPTTADRATPPDWLREELLAGLTSRDPNLQFTCAMVLGEDRLVIPMLRSDDEQKRVVARRFLSKRNSPAVIPLLLESSEEIRAEILQNLESPVPASFVEPLLEVVARSSGSYRSDCVRLLLPNLTEETVCRLIRIGKAEPDAELFRLLLSVERLPAAREVVRTIVKSGLLDPLSDALWRAGQHLDFGDDELLRLAEKGGHKVATELVALAEGRLDTEGCPRPAARFLVRAAFSAMPGEIRDRARSKVCERVWDLLDAAAMDDLFGDRKHFALIILDGLEQSEPSQVLWRTLESLDVRWAEVAEAFTEDRSIFRRFVRAVGRIADGQLGAARLCRAPAAKLLVTLAVADPDTALPAVASLLKEHGSDYECRDVPAWLLEGYRTIAPRVGRALAADLADALTGLSFDSSNSIPAAELLTRLVTDHAALRTPVARCVAKVLDDREWIDTMLRPALDALAEALGGSRTATQEKADEEQAAPAPAAGLEYLDHVVIVAEGSLATLSEYAAFMKALGKSSDPLSLMSAHGLNQETFVACISRWGEALASNDALALRYAQLMQDD